jgi:hypothetical protein
MVIGKATANPVIASQIFHFQSVLLLLKTHVKRNTYGADTCHQVNPKGMLTRPKEQAVKILTPQE